MSEYINLVLSDNESVSKVREAVWHQYMREMKEDKERLAEIDKQEMMCGDVVMKYGLQIIGEAGENGYPLYIALHGGGESDTPDMNDSQWKHMAVYYKEGIISGIYVNPRGVRDTWDTHANPESYPLYDRLIENMILFYNVDPNRVYLMGFSAGGDGVYMIAPRMADRLAAAHMSAGHPNGTSVTNMYNTPIQLQVGELDKAYNRHTVTVEYAKRLDEMAKYYGGGYCHNAFVHYQKGHNFYDNKLSEQTVIRDNEAWLNEKVQDTSTVDTNAIHFLDQFTRNPLPERVTWDLGNRAELRKSTSFYWLRASYDVTIGEIVANINTRTNTITIEKVTLNGDFTILLNDTMVDLFTPITVVTPKGTFAVNANLSTDLIKTTTYERGDSYCQYVAEIIYSKL